MTPPRRALIVIDVQMDYFHGPLTIRHPMPEHALARAIDAMAAAAAHDVPVVVVQSAMPAESPVFVQGTDGWSLHPKIQARMNANTKLVVKTKSSIFADTDLAGWLRARAVDTVTLAGFMTNNCDLASAVEAEGLDFRVEVLSDATGAINLRNAAGAVSAPTLHATLMVLLHSNWASVATTAQWTNHLASGAALPKGNLVDSASHGASTLRAEAAG